jgi:hypothetical protein
MDPEKTKAGVAIGLVTAMIGLLTAWFTLQTAVKPSPVGDTTSIAPDPTSGPVTHDHRITAPPPGPEPERVTTSPSRINNPAHDGECELQAGGGWSMYDEDCYDMHAPRVDRDPN